MLTVACIAFVAIHRYGFQDDEIKSGAVLYSSVLAWNASRILAAAATAHGNVTLAAEMTARAMAIKKAADAQLWNASAGVYVTACLPPACLPAGCCVGCIFSSAGCSSKSQSRPMPAAATPFLHARTEMGELTVLPCCPILPRQVHGIDGDRCERCGCVG